MLAILKLDNAKKVLADNASGMTIPWAFISAAFYQFVELMYSENVLFAQSMDSETANTVHPIFKSGKSLALNINADPVTLLNLHAAKERVHKLGQAKLGKTWDQVKTHVDNFLTHLYMHNIFVAVAEGGATLFLAERMKDANLMIRLHGPDTDVSKL